MDCFLVATILSLRSGFENIYNEFSDINWIHEDCRDKCNIIFFFDEKFSKKVFKIKEIKNETFVSF